MCKLAQVSFSPSAVVLFRGLLIMALLFVVLPTRAPAPVVADWKCTTGSCIPHCMYCSAGCGAAANLAACCEADQASFKRCLYFPGGSCDYSGTHSCDNCKGYPPPYGGGMGVCVQPMCMTGVISCAIDLCT